MGKAPSFTRRDFVIGGLVCAAGTGTSSFATVKNSARNNDAEILELTATEVLQLMRSGDLTAERYTAALLKQCRTRQDLNAFIWFNDDDLLESARSADRTGKGVDRMPLQGLPIVLKDNIDTANIPTTAGTPALRDNRPRADAPVAASLFSAGALLLGKTNMHELAFGITSNNAAFGAVHNPYNLGLIPGGSSGGTAAARRPFVLYRHALTVERPALQAAYREYFRTQDVAAIVFPTTILPARPIGEDIDVELNGKRLPTLLTYTHNTRPVTSAGLPGLSIPIGLTASGLPVGLEFDGPESRDRQLLGIGLSAERVFGRLRAPDTQ